LKEFLFVLMLMTPGAQVPPISEPVATMAECQAKVEKALKDFAAINEDYLLRVGCFVRSKKADPS
jgi:hypothetical protein